MHALTHTYTHLSSSLHSCRSCVCRVIIPTKIAVYQPLSLFIFLYNLPHSFLPRVYDLKDTFPPLSLQAHYMIHGSCFQTEKKIKINDGERGTIKKSKENGQCENYHRTLHSIAAMKPYQGLCWGGGSKVLQCSPWMCTIQYLDSMCEEPTE